MSKKEPVSVTTTTQSVFTSFFQKARVLKQKKEEGNEAFKSGKLSEAHKLYSEALEIDPCNKFTNAKLYFNRATVAAKVEMRSV